MDVIEEHIRGIAALATKAKAKKEVVTSDSLASGGKLYPAQNGGAKKPKLKPAKKTAPEPIEAEEILEELEEEEEEEEEAGGKNVKPAGKCGCGKSASGATCKACTDETKKAFFIPILKAVEEEQTVTGVVLSPEVTDGQGDIYSADVIRTAAFDFLANYNKQTKLGVQHKDFASWQKRLAVVESYTAPLDIVIGGKSVKAGAWVMTVKVLDSKIWALVKQGKITGFSIGGKARVQKLAA